NENPEIGGDDGLDGGRLPWRRVGRKAGAAVPRCDKRGIGSSSHRERLQRYQPAKGRTQPCGARGGENLQLRRNSNYLDERSDGGGPQRQRNGRVGECRS